MRTALTLMLVACTTLAAGQEAAAQKTWSHWLVQLGSDNAAARSEALEHLRSDSAALRDPNVKAGLVNLLDRENQVRLSAEDEGYAEYRSWLSDTVAKVMDWNNPHQVCILANSVDLPDQLADHAKVTVPCLLQRLNNASAQSKGDIVAMLIQALAKGKNELDAAAIETVKRVILNALRDSNEDVKIPTVKALERFGGADMIPALRVVAETDPDPAEHYAIRKWAAEAIEAIQKRARPQ